MSRISGLKVGIISTMLMFGASGCKKAPHALTVKQPLPKKMEQVVDSFYKEGLKVKEDTLYKCIYKDTIELSNKCVKKPKKLEAKLQYMAIRDKMPTEEWDTKYLYYKDPVYVVSSKDVYTDGKKNFIAVEEYDLKD